MKKKTLGNITALSLVQWANYLLPLLVIPYITRVIGPENYGWVEVAQSFALYGIILVNYSFEIAGSRAAARSQGSVKALSNLLSSITSLKLLFFLVYLVASVAALALEQPPLSHWILFLGAALMPLGHALTPNWLFQGLEDVKSYARIALAGKTLALVAVFAWVQSPDDYIYVPAALGLGQVLPGLLLVRHATKRFGLHLTITPLKELKPLLVQGFPLFLVHLASGLNTYLLLLLLRPLLAPEELGYFAAGQKVYLAGLAIALMPIGQALFPRLVKTLETEGKLAFEGQMKQLTLRVGLLFLALAVVGYALSTQVAPVLFGEDFTPSGQVMQWLSGAAFFAALTSVLGYQGMLALSADRAYLAVQLVGLALWLLIFELIPPASAADAGRLRFAGEAILAGLTAVGFWWALRAYRPTA